MPVTHFPNGVSTDHDYIAVLNFQNASTAQAVATYVPYDITIQKIVYVPGTASRVAAIAASIGSAGTSIVASANNTSAAVGVPEELTLASSSVSAGETIVVTRGTQGTAGAADEIFKWNPTSF